MKPRPKNSTAPDDTDAHKPHRQRKSGPKALKKQNKDASTDASTSKPSISRTTNFKAFSIQHPVRVERNMRRTADLQAKRERMPTVDRTPEQPPPLLVALVGPRKVGKTTLLRALVRHFTRTKISTPVGPITIVAAKKQRITFIECNNDINCMIDIAKICDVALLLVDATAGFEMECFEFLSICQAHGMPRVIGVLTHLDLMRSQPKRLRDTKKRLKHRFWTELYQGAKLFYLSNIVNEDYLENDIRNLCRYVLVQKLRALSWRVSHGYILADRMEDMTEAEQLRAEPKRERRVCVYGYVRGNHMRAGGHVHVPGCGDLRILSMSALPDPCPLPDRPKHRSLNERERLVYAPLAGVGGMLYDRDAVYIELAGSHSHASANRRQRGRDSEQMDEDGDMEGNEGTSASALVAGLREAPDGHTIDAQLVQAPLRLFAHTEPLASLPDEAESAVASSKKKRSTRVGDTSGDAEAEKLSEVKQRIRRRHAELNSLVSSGGAGSEDLSRVNWMQLVYTSVGDGALERADGAEGEESAEEEENGADTVRQQQQPLIADLFTRKRSRRAIRESRARCAATGSSAQVDAIDSSSLSTQALAVDWHQQEKRNGILDCFVTGNWGAEDARVLLDSENPEDEDLFGDWVDLEQLSKNTKTNVRSKSRSPDSGHPTALDDEHEDETVSDDDADVASDDDDNDDDDDDEDEDSTDGEDKYDY